MVHVVGTLHDPFHLPIGSEVPNQIHRIKLTSILYFFFECYIVLLAESLCVVGCVGLVWVSALVLVTLLVMGTGREGV